MSASNDVTQSFPPWLDELLADPEENDSEHGRSCHFCGSRYGRYDEPLEHYIDCVWLKVAVLAGVSTEGHTIFEPELREPCGKCGWYYDSTEEWRGRTIPRPPAGDELSEAHDRHVAEEHGITLEEYRFNEMYYWQKWMMDDYLKNFRFSAERGGIQFVGAPDLSDEAIREPGA